MIQILLTRVLLLSGLVTGCTVVYPNGTAVITNNNTAPATSPEPWPSRTPATDRFGSPAPSTNRPTSFNGRGPNEWVGPIALPRGRATLVVRFTADVEPVGMFRLTLRNKEGQFVAPIAAQEGSFETTQNVATEIAGDYYLAVEAAEGDWNVRLDGTVSR